MKTSAVSTRRVTSGTCRERVKLTGRFADGHRIWANKYKRAASRAEKLREKYTRKIRKTMDEAKQQGLLLNHGDLETDPRDYRWDGLSKCGPAELHGEYIPQSAIAGRHDTVSPTHHSEIDASATP